MAGVPKFGDPEIPPKEKITRPTSRNMPFDASGRLKPNGPEFFEPAGIRPDIKDLPWKRRDYDSWTSEAQRAVVKEFLRVLLEEHFPKFDGWEVEEKNSAVRSAGVRPKNPFLVIKVRRLADGVFFEVAIDFTKEMRDDIDAFTARIALAGPALIALS